MNKDIHKGKDVNGKGRGHDKGLANHNSNYSALVLLSLLIDGVGLAMIAGCTVLEGYDLWIDFFNEYWDGNSSSLGFWMTGRFLQLSGLFLLIVHAASFQQFHEFEQAGMLMLTIGPILNLCACSLFDNSESDPYHLFNKQWLASESLELFGISILDISMIDMEETCASMMEFEFLSSYLIPASVYCRMDMIHIWDCIGLGMLTIVSFIQYYLKTHKSHHHHHHSSVSHSLSGDHKD